MSKLTVLVPPPRMHRTRFHGVWAPHAKLRSSVVPQPKLEEAPSRCDGHATKKDLRRYSWAKLLARVFKVDVLTCPKCGAQGMQTIAFVMQTRSLRAILESVGLPADSPQPATSRLPEQWEFAFDCA